MKLNQLLKPEHFAAKIELDESEDCLVLLKNNEPKITFSSHGATLENILLEADKLLEDMK
jgi:hypothetical protein